MKTELEFRIGESGSHVLTDRQFENCEFDNLEIAPKTGQEITIRNVKFINCGTSPGTCVITSGVTLEDVEFANLDCGDALRISSEAKLRRVVVSGRLPKALIVRPEVPSGFAAALLDESDYQIDISEFLGEVSIIGLPGSAVRKDKNRHVTVRASWKERVSWTELGIGPLSYWRIFIRKLTVFNVEEGVFSLPLASNKHFEQTMREKESLENLGCEFQ